MLLGVLLFQQLTDINNTSAIKSPGVRGLGKVQGVGHHHDQLHMVSDTFSSQQGGVRNPSAGNRNSRSDVDISLLISVTSRSFLMWE